MKARRWGATALALAGLALLVQGLWIPAKAQLAQLLLERAWAATSATETARPWPWADTRPVGRLRVPRLGVDLIVLEGDSGRTLAFGPGLAGAPLGGPGTTLVSAHRDTHFRFLPELRPGDRLEVERPDRTRVVYRVAAMNVVDARTARLDGDGGDRLVLATCWPFDALVPGGPLRYVVSAEPLTRQAEPAPNASSRGRNARHRAPPGQTRTYGLPASGSSAALAFAAG